jgi:hypothetical protein
MYIKSAAVLIAALVIGTSSAALATDSDSRFDVNIYRPTVQDNGLSAFAKVPEHMRIKSRDALRARAQERAPGFNAGGCVPQYDSSGVQKAPYCHH